MAIKTTQRAGYRIDGQNMHAYGYTSSDGSIASYIGETTPEIRVAIRAGWNACERSRRRERIRISKLTCTCELEDDQCVECGGMTSGGNSESVCGGWKCAHCAREDNSPHQRQGDDS